MVYETVTKPDQESGILQPVPNPPQQILDPLRGLHMTRFSVPPGPFKFMVCISVRCPKIVRTSSVDQIMIGSESSAMMSHCLNSRLGAAVRATAEMSQSEHISLFAKPASILLHLPLSSSSNAGFLWAS